MALADSVELVVGELCSNAVRHGGGLAGLEMMLVRETMYCPAGVRVLVADYSPNAEPHVRADGLFNEQGRGLALIVALSLRWGWHRLGTDQKQVWCKLAST